jgi:outer membrane protein
MRSRSWVSVVVVIGVLFVCERSRAEPPPAPAPATTDAATERASPTQRKMTLPDALSFARSHQLRLLAAKQRLISLEREARVPDAQWLPRLGAFAEIVGASTNNSTTTVINNAAVDLPRIGATRIDSNASSYDLAPYASTLVALGVRQQLYDFGRVAAETAAIELAVRVEKYRLQGVALDVDFAVEQGFYAVLAARAVADASRGALERSIAHRDFARAGVASGMRPPIDLTRAEADTARYEAGLLRAQGALKVARATFAVVVGVDEMELDVDHNSNGTSSSDASGGASALPSLDDAIAKSQSSPYIRESRARVDAQRAETKRLEAQTRPTLHATASVNGRAGGATPTAGSVPTGDGFVPLIPNYNAGVVLSWSFLEPSWGRRADASREREQAFELEVAQNIRSQRALIATSWQDADVALRTVAALERGAVAAKANYDQAENRFRVGLGTSTELADAQALRTEADIQLAIGRFNMARTRVVLERAIAASAAEVR